MVTVTIDGIHSLHPRGSTVLDALEGLAIEVPTLCDDRRLAPAGKCRTCVVEIDGAPHPLPACTTPLVEGMIIRTRGAALDAQRRTTLRLLAAHYPADAVRASPDKELHRWLRAYGVDGECAGATDPARVDASNPYIRVDMSRCIHCDRCVRICDDLQGQFVWQVWHRDGRRQIRPDSGGALRESSCVSCGACVSACPSGALEDATVIERGAPVAWTRTTCGYCGVGCEMEVGTRDGRIVEILPALDAPVNKGHLCSKGRYAFDFVTARDRLTTPLVREAGALRPASWEEAIGRVAEGLRAALSRHGPSAVGLLGSARATNEENYALQKLARVAIGTNNVDCCARVCHAPSAHAMSTMLGTGAATSSYDDIERAATILVCGANATENHPIVGARIRQRALAGASLIVIDPRRIELARVPGALHLQVRPGANVPLLQALAYAVIDEGLVDEAYVRDRVDGLERLRDSLREQSPERTAPSTGVAPPLVREAARRWAAGPSIAFHGLGVTEHAQGSDGVSCLVNLALLTGNIGRPGSGVNPLRGQNNVQGAAHMGCEPSRLTGYVTLTDGRARFEAVWGRTLPQQPGLDLLQMFDAAAAGALRAMWIMGYDVLLTNPEEARTRRALDALDLLVVQDIFLDETARASAHVVLPSACVFEKDGTFMNAERRVQRVRQVVSPPAEARPDWRGICDVARALGHREAFGWASAAEIWEEIRRVWPAGRGISWRRLDAGGLQWPCPTDEHPGTERLHGERFALDGAASLRCVRWAPTPEQPSPDYPLVLGTGRSMHQFNAGTMTMRTAHASLRPTDLLEVSPQDAAPLGLKSGDRVRVRSRWGEAVLEVLVDANVLPGHVFATFQDARTRLNRVTGAVRDPYTDTPEYKVTAVSLERA